MMEQTGEDSPAKANSDPRCQSPTACQAKVGVICRRCFALDPEARRQASERMKARFQDPKFCERHRRIVSENAKKLNANPLVKRAARERMRAVATNPEIQARRLATQRAQLQDPEIKKKKRAQMMRNFLSPKANAKRKATLVGRGDWLSEQDKKLIAKRVKREDETLAEIGKDFLVSRAAVAAAAKDKGVVRPGGLYHRTGKRLAENQRRNIVHLVKDSPFTLAQIAKKYGTCTTRVSKLAKRRGVVRTCGTARYWIAPDKRKQIKVLIDNPDYTMERIAKVTHVALRNLTRFCKKEGILRPSQWIKKARAKRLARIRYLIDDCDFKMIAIARDVKMTPRALSLLCKKKGILRSPHWLRQERAKKRITQKGQGLRVVAGSVRGNASVRSGTSNVGDGVREAA